MPQLTVTEKPTIRSICVFCGSSKGNKPAFMEKAIAFGEIIAKQNWTLVYGGGSNGLMGAVAKSVLAHGGKVISIIPEALVAPSGDMLGEVLIVKSMHERKRMMAEKSDAFVGLPGGFGTLEELLEMITWSTLGIHSKPLVLLNTHGYYEPIRQWSDRAVESGFVIQSARKVFT
ncbi:putative cytokinin riboside 5'-monophosphate phosphoribohydrolase LOG6, partial [Piptocephalis cylindrospora]